MSAFSAGWDAAIAEAEVALHRLWASQSHPLRNERQESVVSVRALRGAASEPMHGFSDGAFDVIFKKINGPRSWVDVEFAEYDPCE